MTRVLHFPSCEGVTGRGRDNNHDKYRYLGQVASTVFFADPARQKSFVTFFRDHIHYLPIVFEIAAKVIAYLGMFNYSAMHIRRNDLQYKQVFISAEHTLTNVRQLLFPKEVLYIATDESDPSFFEAIEKHYKVFRWKDFFLKKGNYVLKDVKIPRKLEGCIEQVVCASGRLFFGTRHSTFSSYIYRLRGYIKTPVTTPYWHTIRYTGIQEIDKQAIPIPSGTNYMSENPLMWEDLT